MIVTAERFWTWSLAFYNKPGMADACLALQDGQGVDVNILLLLLFLADQGFAAPGHDDIASLDAAILPWRAQAILPLRALRRILKPSGEDAVRRHVAAAELEAERTAQRRLVQALPPLSPGAGTARERALASLRHYNPALSGDLVVVLLDHLAA